MAKREKNPLDETFGTLKMKHTAEEILKKVGKEGWQPAMNSSGR